MAKRYKAGTIFLDVVPSFRGVQKAIKEEVEKYNREAVKNAAELGERAGTEQAEAHAKAAQKVQAKSDEERLSTLKGVNDAIVRDEVKSLREVEDAHKASVARMAAADKRAADAGLRTQAERLAKAESVDEAYIKAREAMEAKARQRSDAEARQARETLWKWEAEGIKEISKAWDDAHAEDAARYREKAKYEREFNNLVLKDQEDLAAAMAEGRERVATLRRKAENEEAKYHRLALERTAAEEKAELDRIAAEARAEQKLAEDKRKADEKAEREAQKARDDERRAEEKLGNEIMAIRRRAEAEAKALEDERISRVSRSGGHIGRLIRKGLAGQLADIPPIEVDADTSEGMRQLQEFRERMLALRNMEIGVDISFKDALREWSTLQKGLKELARGTDGEVRLHAMAALASTKAVNGEVDELERKLKKPHILTVFTRYVTTGRRPDVGGRGGSRGGGILGGAGGSAEDGANAFRVFNPLVLIAVSLLSALGPAAAVAGAGIMGLVGTMAAAVAGIGVLVLAFGGLFTAIQDQIKLEDELAQGDTAAAKQRAAASRRVRDAKEGLADAERNAARASEDASRRVADAERNLADTRRRASEDIADAERRIEDAQRSAEDAQRNLNEARREAKRDLVDLELAYKGSQLDEKEAQNAIVLAQQRLNEVRRRAFMGDATSADVEAAQIDVDQARLRATESTVRRKRAGQDNTRAQRQGVEGSDTVQNALRAQQDAQRNLADASRDAAQVRRDAARSIADAERGVSDALRDQGRVAEDNARMMRDARQSLADAQTALAESGAEMSTAAKNAQQSMDKLHPSARSFALFILSLRDDMARLRGLASAGLFPGLEAGMRELAIYRPGMERFATDMGEMWGTTFRTIGKEMTGPTWRSFFRTMGQDGPKQAGLFNMALFNIVTTLAALTDAFSPFTTIMLTGFERMTGSMAEWAAGLKGSQGFQDFLDYVYRVAPIVGNFFWELGRAIGNIAIALSPLGEGILLALTWAFREISEMDPKLLEMIATGIVAVFIAMQFGTGAVAMLLGLLNPFTTGLSTIAFVVAIAAVALIYFYRTNETVREKVDAALEKLKEFGKWLWDNRGVVAQFAGALVGLFVVFKIAQAFMALRLALQLVGITLSATFGWWILGIALVVAAVTWLWRENETFRKVVTAAWEAVGAVFVWLYETIIEPYFRAIGAIFRWVWNNLIKPVVDELILWWRDIIAPMIVWLWSNVVRPYFTLIGKIFETIWTQFILPVVEGLVYAFEQLVAPVFRWLWNAIIKPIMGWIGDRIANKVGGIVDKFSWVRAILVKYVGPAFSWLWRKVVKPVMGWIADRIKWGWDRVRPNLDKFKDGVDAVKTAFQRTLDGIKRIWGGLVKAVKDPIGTALKFIQTGFINPINKLLDKAGLELRIPTVWTPARRSNNRGAQTGSWKAAGLATGGILPGYTPMAKGDDQLRPMRSGEGVLVSEGLRDDRSKSMFLAANEAAKRGVSFADYFGREGYAKGGIVDLGKRLQDMGYHVSEHPAFGGVVPGAHSATGWHYKGGALDINADSFNSKFGNEMAALDRLNAMLRREGWNTIWRAANHWDHLHVDVAKGGRASGGGGGLMDKVWGFLFDKAEGVIDKVPGDNIFAKATKGFMKKSLSGWEDKILGEAGTLDTGEGSVGGGSGGVNRWKGVVSRALGIMGQSPMLMNTVLRRMKQESSGNPRIVNTWDSNAKRGTPSKGLMQVIDPTFRAYAHPRYNDNIFDPLSNILASMRYAIATYGSLSAAYNRAGGYATGTDSATPGWHMVGEEGPELMRFAGGEQVYNRRQTLRLAELSAKGGGGFSGTVLVQNPWTGEYHEARMQAIVDDNDQFKTSVGRMGG